MQKLDKFNKFCALIHRKKLQDQHDFFSENYKNKKI